MYKNRLFRLIQNPFLQACFIFSSVLTVFKPVYEEVDDVNATRMVNGAYAGTPYALIHQIHIFLSWPMAQFYRTYPDVNWYSAICYGALFLSLVATGLLFRPYTKNNLLLKIGIAVIVVCIYIRAITQFQYVTIAGLCAVSGILMLLKYARAGNLSNRVMVLSAILTATSYMLREQAAYLAIVLALPLGVFIWKTGNKKIKRQLCIFSLSVVGIMIFLHVINVSMYRTSEQLNADKDIFDVQIAFNSYDIYNYTFHKNLYKKIGWTQNDFEMFNTWSYEDSHIFSVASLKKIMASVNHEKPSPQYLNYALKIFQRNVLRSGGWYMISAFITAVISFLLFRKERLLIALTVLDIICVEAYFSYIGRVVPFRVGIPITFFLCGLMYVLLQEKINLRYGKAMWLIYAVLFCALAATALFTFTESMTNANDINQFKKLVNELPTKDKALMFVWDSSIPFYWISPLDNYSTLRKYALAGSGWTQRLAPDRELLRRYGITNLYKQLYQKDNVLLLANDDYLRLYEKFMTEHYNVHVGYRVLKDFAKYETVPRYGYGGKLVKIYKQ